MDGLRFEADGHRYFFGDALIPSVTQVLRLDAFGPGVSLSDPYAHVPPDILARASARGTAVHEVTADMDRGQLDDLSLTAQTVTYAARYEEWLGLSGYTPIDTEVRLYHPVYHYAGTLDMVGWLGTTRVIGDRKTENAFKPEAFQQVAAYREGWNHAHPNQPVERTGILILRAGRPAVWKWNPHEDESFLYFIAALARWRAAQEQIA